jgi:hypothetical protein
MVSIDWLVRAVQPELLQPVSRAFVNPTLTSNSY